MLWAPEMLDSLRDHHTELLTALFAVTVITAAWLEVFAPRRPLAAPRLRRWISNLSFGGLNILIFTAAAPLGVFGAALLAEQNGWGVLRLTAAPPWLSLPLGVLALDLVGYVLHRAWHGLPVLWRLHHVHHSDIDIDFTTTVRHHPGEALITGTALFGVVLALGISPESVALQQIATSALDVVSHSNWRMAARLERWLRYVVVTPDMHVVHHSAERRETDSNYAALFSAWDRLFGTYVAAPAGTVSGMTIGLGYGRAPREQRLDRLLISPLVAQPRFATAVEPAALAAME